MEIPLYKILLFPFFMNVQKRKTTHVQRKMSVCSLLPDLTPKWLLYWMNARPFRSHLRQTCHQPSKLSRRALQDSENCVRCASFRSSIFSVYFWLKVQLKNSASDKFFKKWRKTLSFAGEIGKLSRQKLLIRRLKLLIILFLCISSTVPCISSSWSTTTKTVTVYSVSGSVISVRWLLSLFENKF